MFGLDPTLLALAAAITIAAGFVKGVVGFAMPMIMISGMASFLPAEQALAALILPTFATNLVQAFRHGWRAALTSVWQFRWLIGITCLCIVLSAQLVTSLPQALLLGGLGLPVAAYAAARLGGASLRFPARNRRRAEVLTGVVGGLSGVWGPPIIALLVSLDIPKQESVRIQGVVYLIGSAMLLVAHLGSGVLNAATLPLSGVLVVPAFIGLWAGFQMHDRLDAARFRRWTLIVLLVTGANLLRRALMM